jgi:hypothetical protein
VQDLLPKSVLDSIREAYLRGISAAERGYIFGQEDEDVLTGALGQALLSEDRAVVENREVYVWRITYNKFRGRGKNAAEKILGADGIFQIDVRDAEGQILRRKGLLFQAKKGWQGKDAKLASQASLLAWPPGVAVVINYTPNGYKACLANIVNDAEGDRCKIAPEAMKSLTTTLGEDSLLCRVGLQGLFYNPLTKVLEFPFGLKPPKQSYRHVITTKVIRVQL